MKLHPANRLALWLWLASLLPWLERQYLYVTTVLIVILALVFARERFWRALPRVRWLLLALGVVYGWTTPGEYLWSGWFAPTYEGLGLGLMQTMRLFAVVASLQLLLTNMPPAAIFAGLHALAAPLDWFGLSRNRMALRLTLTLEMMENLLEARQALKGLMLELHLPLDAHDERKVDLHVLAMSWTQRAILSALLAAVLATLWLGGQGGWV